MTTHEEGTWDADHMSPYVHWRRSLEAAPTHAPTMSVVGKSLYVTSTAFEDALPDIIADAVAPLFGTGEVVPIPQGVDNPSSAPLDSFLPDDIAGVIPNAPPQDAVITGIIDEAIALGHPRFRNADGSTRFLASWQQGASFDPAQQGYLPFGHELYQSDLNQLLRQFSDAGDPRQSLDETGFNRAAKLSEPTKPYGVRALDRRAGHGTAVLDLAAGEDAWRADPTQLARRPIIAASLPRRDTIGMSGAFLEYFVIYAMHRIVALADAIWDAHIGGPGGYPVVLNLSYGQQAGPKDGSSLFEQAAERLMASRSGRAPVRVIMPVGNDNLERCNAQRKVRRGSFLRENWRIQPDDHSSNFVEIWTAATTRPNARNPLEVKVGAPNKPCLPAWTGTHGTYCEFGGGARIYCQQVIQPDGDYRYRYVVCTPPTAGENLPRMATAGLWRLSVTNRGPDTDVYMNVQVDQAAVPEGQRNKRSYLDNEKYRTHLENGRVRDSFAYPIDPAHPSDSDQEKRQLFGNVKRKGTVNSLAVSDQLIVVGGYRASDGAPALYSATSYPRGKRPGDNTKITLSLPSDDGALHSGRLAAGTMAGTVLVPRGTSFAAARATRMIVDALLAGETGSVKWARRRAQNSEPSVQDAHGAAHPLRIGHGRVPDPQTDREVLRV